MKMNFYELLEVESDATSKQIKDAYYRLSKKYHPDTEGGEQEKFNKINEAYQTLKDPVSRKHYDVTGKVEPLDAEGVKNRGLKVGLIAIFIQKGSSQFKQFLHNTLDRAEAETESTLNQHGHTIASYQQFKLKIMKAPEDDLITGLIDQQIELTNELIKTAEELLKSHQRAIRELLEEYTLMGDTYDSDNDTYRENARRVGFDFNAGTVLHIGE